MIQYNILLYHLTLHNDIQYCIISHDEYRLILFNTLQNHMEQFRIT